MTDLSAHPTARRWGAGIQSDALKGQDNSGD